MQKSHACAIHLIRLASLLAEGEDENDTLYSVARVAQLFHRINPNGVLTPTQKQHTLEFLKGFLEAIASTIWKFPGETRKQFAIAAEHFELAVKV